jgi:hypothetical protein
LDSTDLKSTAEFGTGGGCYLVSPVFAYLLNTIHDAKVVEIHELTAHVVLKTTNRANQFIDATWRQADQAIYAWDEKSNNNGRYMLAMVRVTEEEPTLENLALGVINGLLEIYELPPKKKSRTGRNDVEKIDWRIDFLKDKRHEYEVDLIS